MSKLSELTSMRVGGEPAELKVCETREQLIETTKKVWSSGEDWLLIGGGTNMVVSESIEDLSVIQIKTKGIEKKTVGDKQIWRIQAGEDWDELVAKTVSEGLAGIEAMSGIPGSVGASPVQNIGAYGQELSDVFLKAEFLDYESGELVILEPKDMKFGYRDSAIKKGRLGLITWIEIELLDLAGKARPLYSGQIAKDLNSEMGAQPSLVQVRESVLKLRASKSMVLDPKDPNSVSQSHVWQSRCAHRFKHLDDQLIVLLLGRRFHCKEAWPARGAVWMQCSEQLTVRHTVGALGKATVPQIKEIVEPVDEPFVRDHAAQSTVHRLTFLRERARLA